MGKIETHAEIQIVQPLTEKQFEILSLLTGVSFAVAVIAFVVLLVATFLVAKKTRLPGRRSILASVALLPAFWGYEQYMGGNLEMVFGSVALLVSGLVYSLFAIVFSIGLTRMSFYCRRLSLQQNSNQER